MKALKPLLSRWSRALSSGTARVSFSSRTASRDQNRRF